MPKCDKGDKCDKGAQVKKRAAVDTSYFKKPVLIGVFFPTDVG